MEHLSKNNNFKILQRLFHFVKPHQALFYVTAFSTILAAILSPLRPYLIEQTIDRTILHKDIHLLYKMIFVLIAVLIFEVLIQFTQTYYANLLGQTVVKDLRNKLFKRLLDYKLSFYDKTPIGTLVTRVISDIETIADVFSQGTLSILGDLIKFTAVLCVMFYTDWRLTIFSLITLPFLVLSAILFKKAIRKSFQKVRTQVSALNTFIQEHLGGMFIVQVFNREPEEMKRFKQLNDEHKKANIHSIWAYSIFFPVVEILSAISLAGMVWWGAHGIINQQISFGSLVAFILYIHMLFRPIRQMADNFNVLQMGMISAERVFKLMDIPNAIPNGSNSRLPHCKGEVSFKNVWFSYDQSRWILEDFSLHIKPGNRIAIVGATGAGKTSIIQLLAKFHEYQKGEIRMDNILIQDICDADYHRFISMVTQDIFLFSGTLIENITLGSSKISLEQVVEAAQKIGIHEFIEGLPEKYFFKVHERGGNLSLGQRQLLCFLRAFVSNPQILILDEATSSVDQASEYLIQKATDVLTKDRTSIIIAHRLSTVQSADRILVLEKGKIIESGTHDELLLKQGHYKKLYELQFTQTTT